MSVVEYLESEYEQTKWPYFSGVKLKTMFGEKGRLEVLELINQGKARKVSGINGTLIELIKSSKNEHKRVSQKPSENQ